MSLPPPLNQDAEHLRLLSIFHYIVGGLTALLALIPLIHLAVGLMLVFAPDTMGSSNPPPAAVGWLFAGFALVFILVGQGMAICMIMAGRALSQRRRYTFAFVVACVECVFMPFGTVLGVFTILVLSRPSVKALFSGGRR